MARRVLMNMLQILTHSACAHLLTCRTRQQIFLGAPLLSFFNNFSKLIEVFDQSISAHNIVFEVTKTVDDAFNKFERFKTHNDTLDPPMQR